MIDQTTIDRKPRVTEQSIERSPKESFLSLSAKIDHVVSEISNLRAIVEAVDHTVSDRLYTIEVDLKVLGLSIRELISEVRS